MPDDHNGWAIAPSLDGPAKGGANGLRADVARDGRTIQVVKSLTGFMHMVSIRSAVYLSEQACPFAEEFDGNDFAGLHLVCYVGSEPAGCIRARFFSSFAKLERLAVRHEFRTSSIAFDLVRAGIHLCRRKGYSHIYGHAQDRLVPFWKRFGARPVEPRRRLVFSDFSYTEMLLVTTPLPNAVTLESDPYVIIRQEGEWDELGPLDRSAARPASAPLRKFNRN